MENKGKRSEKMKQNEKCRKGRFCDDLSALIRPLESSTRGFVSVPQIRISQLNKKQIGLERIPCVGVGYKDTVKDRGVMLNYCPFCGEEIDWFRGKSE